MDKEFRVSRLMWRYARSGGVETQYVRRFASWPEEIRSSILAMAAFNDIPFLVFYENPSTWTALALSEMAWMENVRVRQVAYSSLKDADLTRETYASLQEMFASAEHESRAVAAKRNARIAELVRNDGGVMHVQFEASKPFWGFYNLLLLLIRQHECLRSDDGHGS